MPRMVQWIWLLMAVHFAMGAIAFTHFLATGQYTLLTVYFNVEGTPFFIAMAVIETTLALTCCVWLDRGDPMRTAWVFIALAAAARASGALLHALAMVMFPWRALAWTHVHPFGPFDDLGQLGTIIGSPLAMCLLGVGLALILLELRRRHIFVKLTRFDICLIVLILCFTISQVIVVLPLFKFHPNLVVELLWTSDPLLLLLLVEAVMVRRAMIRIGDGFFARCLGMYVLGIIITSAGDATIWANWHGLLTPALTVLSWYIWFVASAAFSSAPAYQMAAIAQTLEDRNRGKDGFEGHSLVPPAVR
ncbi:MAG: hypothetical protein P4L40_16260 [Terracidiphilus sp.]|nr:hypothetical protein [Terracidiphilus sp.]